MKHMKHTKKFGVLFSLVLVFAAVGSAWACLDFDDPALCVNGQWLVVNAAAPSAVSVVLAKGSRYGDQAAGGCTTPAPAPLFPGSVVVSVQNPLNMIVVGIDGRFANPTVTTSYGASKQTQQNPSGAYMLFTFMTR